MLTQSSYPVQLRNRGALRIARRRLGRAPFAGWAGGLEKRIEENVQRPTLNVERRT
jgi:hypothetical protein